MPVSLGWILLVAAFRAFRNEGYNMRPFLVWGIRALIVIGAASLVWDSFVQGQGEGIIEDARTAETGAPDAAAGGFPVPPLDAPHYHGVTSSGRGAGNNSEVSSGLH